MKELWTERYRPKTTADYVFRDSNQKTQVQGWIASGAMPHLLFSGAPGTGKTTLAKVLLHELDVDDMDILIMNGSSQNGVDEVRDRITNFASTMSFGDMRYVLLDECLDENTEVMVLRNNEEIRVPIKYLDDNNDLVKSYNESENRIEWKPFTLFNKGVQETLEIEFANGEVVICTPDHKWYVCDNGETKVVKASELYKYEHILTT